MTALEQVRRTIKFEHPTRFTRNLPDPYGTDFAWTGMDPNPDYRPPSGTDEWGAVWGNIGVSNLGEVKDFPLKDWVQWDSLKIPDITDPRRWKSLEGARERAGDRFLLASGISIYERAHFLRGLENLWCDIHENPEELCRLLDVLTDMNVYAIERYREAGVDGYFFCDDWGLQDRLMIDPKHFRQFWKPRYARIFQAARKAGMCTLLHSCGYTLDVLGDWIEAGLDVIQYDQQENMGLQTLGERFRGKVTFLCPVDIQKTMVNGTLDDIRAYARAMFGAFRTPAGGFIPTWYSDPTGAGHRQEAIRAMCEEFVRVGGLETGD